MLSPGNWPTVAAEGRGGEGRLVDEAAFTAFWLEGRMLSEGDVGIGGGGIWFDDCLRDVARECGDGGTELRSGILVGGRLGLLETR